MASSRARAFELFWDRTMRRIRSEYPEWRMPAKAPPRYNLALDTEVPWFSYGLAFPGGELRSELYIKVPGDMSAGQRIMNYLRSRQAELEAAYGKRLKYQDPSQMQVSDEACRLADYRSGSIDDAGHCAEYIDWFLDSQARLRSAVDRLGGLSALRDQGIYSKDGASPD